MIRWFAALILLFALGGPLLAQTSEGEPGRFTMSPVPDGMLRLDTRTGRVSLCKSGTRGWTCEQVADERAAYEQEIARLQGQVAKLEAELSRRPGGPSPELKIPSDAELDRMMGFFEKVFRRFLGMVENLRREYAPGRS
jgi:hypothetical protein